MYLRYYTEDDIEKNVWLSNIYIILNSGKVKIFNFFNSVQVTGGFLHCTGEGAANMLKHKTFR